MNKDVIYIDVDDDITAIIGKIKASKERIIALVPPKRIGVLQSAVNLRLLDRMAKTSKKNLVIITNNQALVALTASAHIPTARNLQSKPEIAEIPALSVDDGDDIIDGADLPVSDHMKSAGQDMDDAPAPKKRSRDEVVETLAIDGETVESSDEDATEAVIGSKAIKSAAKSKSKIPNFNTFRKRLSLIVIGVIGLTALLIWMFIFAPAATITVTAGTSPSPISTTVTLAGTAATNYEKGQVKSLSEELKKDETIEFEATGKKDVGTKAKGTVEFRNCETDTAQTIPAGTTITSGDGISFVTEEDATVGGAQGFSTCSTAGTSESIEVTAAEVGSSYNISSGTQFSVAGHSNNAIFYFRAVADTDATGGESHEVTVVSAADIERAKGDLIGKSTDDQKKDLISKSGSDTLTIESSFSIKRGATTSSPAVGKEVADGQKAKLTIATTYSIHGISKAELESYLKANLEDRLNGNANQRVYDTGVDSAGLSGYKKGSDDKLTVTLTATGQVGPNIDETAVKDIVKGKITGDVQSTLESIDGIQDVSVKYSYFWVRTVPNDTNKIHLEFKLQEDGS